MERASKRPLETFTRPRASIDNKILKSWVLAMKMYRKMEPQFRTCCCYFCRSNFNGKSIQLISFWTRKRFARERNSGQLDKASAIVLARANESLTRVSFRVCRWKVHKCDDTSAQKNNQSFAHEDWMWKEPRSIFHFVMTFLSSDSIKWKASRGRASGGEFITLVWLILAEDF